MGSLVLSTSRRIPLSVWELAGRIVGGLPVGGVGKGLRGRVGAAGSLETYLSDSGIAVENEERR